nr:immunoglobulin light chain junction region [Macaca mulatta]MOW17469.1 immunoglobulin light chain junction region [Macaca mulatta]
DYYSSSYTGSNNYIF